MRYITYFKEKGDFFSVQASNGILNDVDKQKFQLEINQIDKEVNRIANGTKFNTINLLNVNLSCRTDKKGIIKWL
jgi:flagellin-like hook-associated protein FlgL